MYTVPETNRLNIGRPAPKGNFIFQLQPSSQVWLSCQPLAVKYCNFASLVWQEIVTDIHGTMVSIFPYADLGCLHPFWLVLLVTVFITGGKYTKLDGFRYMTMYT